MSLLKLLPLLQERVFRAFAGSDTAVRDASGSITAPQVRVYMEECAEMKKEDLCARVRKLTWEKDARTRIRAGVLSSFCFRNLCFERICICM